MPQRGELVVPDARKGETYRLVIEGSSKGRPLVLPLADADMLQGIAADELVFFYNLAGQYYVGTRVFTRAEQDEITITNPYRQPFSIRDALTGELLHRYTMADPARDTFRVGRGRFIQITMTGRLDGRLFKGVSPWFARTRESWFEPNGN